MALYHQGCPLNRCTYQWPNLLSICFTLESSRFMFSIYFFITKFLCVIRRDTPFAVLRGIRLTRRSTTCFLYCKCSKLRVFGCFLVYKFYDRIVVVGVKPCYCFIAFMPCYLFLCIYPGIAFYFSFASSSVIVPSK